MWLRFYYRQSKVVYSLSFCRFTLSKVFSSENTVSIDVKFHMMGERVFLQIQDMFSASFCQLIASFNFLKIMLCSGASGKEQTSGE